MKNDGEKMLITDAVYISDYKVKITFADNTEKTIDFGIFLKNYPHPQHNKYLDLKNFKKFKIDGGNIIWGKNWDLIFNPRQLYKGVNPQ
jgi:hypothetical protein